MGHSAVRKTKTNDFSQGAMWKNILSMAVPMMIAQIIQLLYNIVDRVYIGHLPGGSTVPLTALGLTFPVITVITAFTNLFGMGGSPLCSIARGQGDIDRAEKIMGNAFAMLMVTGAVLVTVLNLSMKPVLYAFGAGENTYPLASQYLRIYLWGTFFSMAGLGMNSFINSQGFGRKGMTTILIGAVANIVLDPIFIFIFRMGVQGAALATVISQGLSAFFCYEVSFKRQSCLPIKTSVPQTGSGDNPQNNRVGIGKFYHVCHQRPDSDSLQYHAKKIRR